MALLSCGCNNIENRRGINDIHEDINQSNSITSSSRQIIQIPQAETETYSTFTFYERDERFLSSCIFVGDSIILKIPESGLLKEEQVFAKEDATTTSITEAKFIHGDSQTGVLTWLVNENPENVIILLGMNEIPISNVETFVNDYLNLISLFNTFNTDVKITVLSITPITVDKADLNNNLIQLYNTELKSAVEGLNNNSIRFVDLGSELKNSNGRLKSRYAQNDGVHLTEAGYYAVLWSLCNSVR